MKQRYALENLETYAANALEQTQKEITQTEEGTILAYVPDTRFEIPFVRSYMELLPVTKFFFPKVEGQELLFYSVQDFSELKRGLMA